MLDEASAVFTNRFCKLVSDYFPIGAGSASRRHYTGLLYINSKGGSCSSPELRTTVRTGVFHPGKDS